MSRSPSARNYTATARRCKLSAFQRFFSTCEGARGPPASTRRRGGEAGSPPTLGGTVRMVRQARRWWDVAGRRTAAFIPSATTPSRALSDGRSRSKTV